MHEAHEDEHEGPDQVAGADKGENREEHGNSSDALALIPEHDRGGKREQDQFGIVHVVINGRTESADTGKANAIQAFAGVGGRCSGT